MGSYYNIKIKTRKYKIIMNITHFFAFHTANCAISVKHSDITIGNVQMLQTNQQYKIKFSFLFKSENSFRNEDNLLLMSKFDTTGNFIKNYYTNLIVANFNKFSRGFLKKSRNSALFYFRVHEDEVGIDEMLGINRIILRRRYDIQLDDFIKATVIKTSELLEKIRSHIDKQFYTMYNDFKSAIKITKTITINNFESKILENLILDYFEILSAYNEIFNKELNSIIALFKMTHKLYHSDIISLNFLNNLLKENHLHFERYRDGIINKIKNFEKVVSVSVNDLKISMIDNLE